MSKTAHVGSRLREERLRRGLRQGMVAQTAGISASYLNLIEHNRRRIGGKLLLDLAAAIGVEATALSTGAEAGLVAALRSAVPDASAAEVELEQVEGFAARFPGWAAFAAGQARSIEALEQTVRSLTDRLTHDPLLSTSLHEVLSSATSIRSSASILTETADIDPEWQARFLRNIRDDSHRLGEGAEALVEYLDASGDEADAGSTPQDQLETFLQDNGYHLPALEGPGAPDAEEFAAARMAFSSPAARAHGVRYFRLYLLRAAQMPLEAFQTALAQHGDDPGILAQTFGVSARAVLERWAMMPDPKGEVGLLSCDNSGAITFRKPIEGFPMPRFGDLCPLWAVFLALSRPSVPLRQVVALGDATLATGFECFAVAEPLGAPRFGATPAMASTMLLRPVPLSSEAAQPVGTSCRICPHHTCAARREPSILA